LGNSAQHTSNKINLISCDNDVDNLPATSISPLHELRKIELIRALSNQGIDKLTAQAIAEAKFENQKPTPRFNIDETEDIKSGEHIILELNCSGYDFDTSDSMDL